ncbi:hypothetical protein lerEdw1_020989 [Lerista edwardsae]|nr:hypothetical protein lerEdw1_020989 [Lerista edwardsae]
MEKLGMSFGGGPSRKELLEAVEAQKKQLAQYQARLKDVVRAYKSLQKEKEALEASLKVLSAPQETDAGPSQGAACWSPAPSEDSEDSAAPGEPGAGEAAAASRPEEACSSESGLSSGSGGAELGACEADRRAVQLKAQLATLTSALATVTQEKSRMEASYQADRKAAKQEREELGRKAEEERSRLEGELREVQEQLAETKARLIAQQHDRAQEQSDHALMLHELQRLLQSERGLRREAELNLEETLEALAGKASVADRVQGYEQQTRQLAHEVEQLKRELQTMQEEGSRPDPHLQELQNELTSLKSHFQAQLLQEMKKVIQREGP